MPLPAVSASLHSFMLNRTARYVLAVLCVTAVLLTLFNFAHGYARADLLWGLSAKTSALNASSDALSGTIDPSSVSAALVHTPLPKLPPPPAPTPAPEWHTPDDGRRRANATLLMLARNSELEKAASSVSELENKFNHEFKYPWVFLNEVPFSDEFKERMTELASGPVHFGMIPAHHWYQPDWIDEVKATQGRNEMVEADIIYGGSVSYRNMCRFNSGFFYRHPILQNYRWYWRVEPDVHFHCVVDEDPFLYMEENDKHYGFTITLLEFEKTVATLWKTTKDFITENPHFLAPNNSVGYLSDDNGESYNMCHFWSNFEIADMDFWRGEAYSAYFDYLDTQGGFYYERWGDAPVHSIAAALFLRKDQIHFFDAIGYEHTPFTHCPHGKGVLRAKQCTCRGWRSFDYQAYSCMRQWERIHK